MIGILTAIIGDLASIFGCLIKLDTEVTAITFVALGTSLPDLFASRNAAMNEKYADASIGNVTGSNSVNVFLGLGTSWLIASIYHASKVRMCFINVPYHFRTVSVYCLNLIYAKDQITKTNRCIQQTGSFQVF